MALKIKCPSCNISGHVVPIIYGMPNEKAIQKQDKGNAILGGCLMEEGAPKYHCKDCEFEWTQDKLNMKALKTTGQKILKVGNIEIKPYKPTSEFYSKGSTIIMGGGSKKTKPKNEEE